MTRSEAFDNLEVVTHPVIEIKLAKLRNKNTPPQDFRRILFELAGLMSAAVFRHIKTIEIETLPNKSIINILKLGFKKDNISEISNGSLALDIDERPLIIKLISDDSFSIDYLDNLNILNTILFKELK